MIKPVVVEKEGDRESMKWTAKMIAVVVVEIRVGKGSCGSCSRGGRAVGGMPNHDN